MSIPLGCLQLLTSGNYIFIVDIRWDVERVTSIELIGRLVFMKRS